MQVPMSWLKAYVDIDCDLRTFMESMTMSGSKVEGAAHLGAEISNVVVGRVLSVAKHPDADKLVVTQIDVGREAPVQVVTGATNVFEGLLVPVALDGATLARGMKIKKGKLRGEVSDGMLCSVEELGYTRHDYPEAPEDGIYIFKENHPVGADVRPILELVDDVVEYEITSNRPDCFSILGIAREAAATFEKPFRYPNVKVAEKADGDVNELVSIAIENAALCPRYAARVVKNVKIEPSPQWMRHRLTAAGVKPINNIVDVTNYVMLEMGQPMHAFDIDCIKGGIIVRNAKAGESITTLDGTERALDPSMLVIADHERAVAVAGVMGGENSKITGGAGAVLFESATFDGTNIRLTSKKLGLRTDASSKFEKGLDPNLALEAVNRAAQLIEENGWGEVVRGVADCYPAKREPRLVPYTAERVNALLGTSLTAAEMEAYLARVAVMVKDGKAVAPTFRPDLESEADIAEEVARLYGYNNIEATLAAGTPTVGKKTGWQLMEDTLKNALVAFGFNEALTYAFESPKVFAKLGVAESSPLRGTVTISNPLGEDFSIMRTTTANGMLMSLATNYNRRNESAALFELAKVYIPKALPLTELPEEKPVLTIGMYGKKDFYDLKGVIEGIVAQFGVRGVDFEPISDCPYLHPGRAAAVAVGGETFGVFGEVHPDVADRYGIGAKAYLAELNMKVLFANMQIVSEYEAVPRFPAIRRDIAMLVRDEVLVRDIENTIRERSGKLVETVKLFDVYKGQNVPDGHKSVAYSISFRAPDRTLTDDEVQAVMKKILENLEGKVGAQLRDK